jgi:type I restriction enzyme S subunit
MKGWQSKTLGEILLKTETANPGRSPDDEFNYIDVSSVSNETYTVEATQRLKWRDAPSRARRRVRSGDVILATIRPTLKRIAVIPPDLDSEVCSTGYFVLRPSAEIDHRFLFYSLFTERFMGAMESLQKGASYPAVSDAEVRAQSISFPAIREQRRIVTILEEAFKGIATAKANAEKNLQSARELPIVAMRRALTVAGGAWTESTIGDQVTLQRGFDITKNQQRDGLVPVVSSGGIRSYHDTSMVQAPGVVMGRKGTLGKVYYLEEDFWPHDTTLWVKKFNNNDPRFVYRFFEVLDVQNLDSGAANPALNRNQVHPIRVLWPPLDEQISIAERIERISTSADQLALNCLAKLSALDDLKNSLLHQAFTGQLVRATTLSCEPVTS